MKINIKYLHLVEKEIDEEIFYIYYKNYDVFSIKKIMFPELRKALKEVYSLKIPNLFL